MMKKASKIFKYLLGLSLIKTFFVPTSSLAFFPRINEPSQKIVIMHYYHWIKF